MRLIIFAAAVVMATAAYAGQKFDTYANSRYGYSISYPPDLLIPQRESDDGDGRIFTSKDGKAEFRIYAAASFAGIDDTSETVVKSAEQKCPGHRASYRVVKPHLAAMSCVAGTELIYQKTILENGMDTTFMGAYPAAQRAIWDPAVAAMAQSLTPASSGN
jgi:hypothetical protein